MRKLLLILLLIPFFAQSQVWQQNNMEYGFQYKGLKTTKALLIPLVQTTAGQGRDTGAIYYRLTDSSVYVNTGSQWRQIGAGGGGGSVAWGGITGTLSNQTDLQNALNLKLNISDTAAMLSPYLRSNTAAATYVPYTGATGSVNLGPWGLTTDRLVFNQSPTLSGGVGILRWNDTDGTLEFGMKGGNVTQQIGQELPVLMRNSTGSTITNGQVVYMSGSTGTNTIVALAKADAAATSKATIGIATEDIPNGQTGFITTFGKVRDINTTGLTEGALVYLSSTVAGGLTSTPPTGDTYPVVVGICERTHAVNGVIFVHVDREFSRKYEVDTALNNRLQNITGLVTEGTGINVTGSGTSVSPYVVALENTDSTAARTTRGTYAQRIALASPQNGDLFTQTDRLQGLYLYKEGSWRFQGDPLSFWYYTNFSRGQTVNTVAEGYNTGPLALTGASSTDFIVNQKPYSDGWLRALLKASDVTITVPGFDSLEVDSVIIWHETEILVDAVSDGTDSYGVSWGYDNASGSYTSGDRIVLRYNHSASSGNWESRTVAATSGVWTTKDTGVPFVAGSRMKLAIEIDGYARTIKFYINDALVTTHTSSDNVPFPNATTLATGISPSMFNFDRLAGSTTRAFEVNYMFGYIIKKNF